MEFVNFLKYFQRYKELGVKIFKGVFLIGFFGIGKILLVKVIVGEVNVFFFSVFGFEFLEMFVGVGFKRVYNIY